MRTLTYYLDTKQTLFITPDYDCLNGCGASIELVDIQDRGVFRWDVSGYRTPHDMLFDVLQDFELAGEIELPDYAWYFSSTYAQMRELIFWCRLIWIRSPLYQISRMILDEVSMLCDLWGS